VIGAQRFLAQKHDGGSHQNRALGRFFRGPQAFAASQGTTAAFFSDSEFLGPFSVLYLVRRVSFRELQPCDESKTLPIPGDVKGPRQKVSV